MGNRPLFVPGRSKCQIDPLLNLEADDGWFGFGFEPPCFVGGEWGDHPLTAPNRLQANCQATPDLWSLAHVNGHVQAPNGMTGRRGNLNGESGRGPEIFVGLSCFSFFCGFKGKPTIKFFFVWGGALFLWVYAFFWWL